MKSLHVQQLQAFIASRAGDTPPARLLDVREPWETALAPLLIAGTETLVIPMNDIPGRMAELDPAQPIVCFCHHGMRSAQVVAFLMHHGLSDVYNLAGGIAAWSTLVDAGVAQY